MKTSNKIFSFGFLTSVLVAISTLIFFKSNMTPVEQLVGEGAIVSEIRTVDAFDKLYSEGSVKVQLHYGEPKIEVSTYENIIDEIETTVTNGELTIRLRSNFHNNGNNSSTVHVTTKNLNQIKANGGANVSSKDTMAIAKVNLEANGGGRINLLLNTIDVQADASGGGQLHLSGHATNLTSDVHGGGQINAFGFNVINASMSVSGGGRAKVNAENLTKAKASGGGQLYYKGNPSINDLDISGGGQIKKQ